MPMEMDSCLGHWKMLAEDRALWMQLGDDFAKFWSTRCCFGLTMPAPLSGLPSDMQAQSQSQSAIQCFVRRTSSPSRAFADILMGNDSVSRSADFSLSEAYHEKGPHATPVPRSEFQHHQSLRSPRKGHTYATLRARLVWCHPAIVAHLLHREHCNSHPRPGCVIAWSRLRYAQLGSPTVPPAMTLHGRLKYCTVGFWGPYF